ncbi:MAG TPA: helix-turn-helix domain-containing protein [Chitinophagaceae bacterium]|nr:helix-turn-helix domain-containing protein [Chitinophagaceae bacterium]
MIKIEYDLISYEDFFRHIAKCLKLKIADNIISFTPDKGAGFIKFVNLPNDLQLIIYDYTTFQDILYHRKKSDRDNFTLRLDEFTGADGITKSSVFFGDTSKEWIYMAAANTQLRQVNIIFSKKWMDDYFADETSGEMLGSYISLKSPLVMYELMDAEYKRLMNEIMNLQTDKSFEQMIVQNRIALIVERFFYHVYKGIHNENNVVKISSHELRTIKNIESELLKDFSQQPPAIAQLARVAAMSPSKLKILFKEVFGLPINQYYQKHRMNKAKAMLLSKKHSVKDAANALGFSSMSSFNKAFFKAFEEFPGDITVSLK